MKNTIIYLFALLFTTCCAPKYYYQLYEMNSNEVEVEEDIYIYENNDVRIIYDLWGDLGNGSFLVYNKTDMDIFIDLESSHLIVNNIAKTYFQNRMITEATSSSTSFSSTYSNYYSQFLTMAAANFSVINYIADGHLSSYGNIHSSSISSSYQYTSGNKFAFSKGMSVSYNQEKVVCIPGHSAKIIPGFYLKHDVYRNCDILRFPSKKRIKSLAFTNKDTPLKIKNILTYCNDRNLNDTKKIVNIFWVYRITNYPSLDFFVEKKQEYCGQQLGFPINYFKYSAPDKFYIRYRKPTSTALFKN